MTASNPMREPLPLDSTAQLMTRITSRLGTQLSHVSLNGRSRPGRPPALVAVAHGSRDPRALATVTALLERVRELRPGLTVHLGHIELNEPLLADVLPALAAELTPGTDRTAPATVPGPPATVPGPPGPTVVAPLLLSRGHHAKHDIPAAAAAVPGLPSLVAAPLGPHPLLVETLYARLVEAGWPVTADGRDLRTSAVVLAAAGSRDPDAAADTRRTAAMLAERLGVPVVAAYASALSPTVPAAVRALAARGRHRVAVASYFTAPGRFASQCAQAAPWLAAAPLGAHPAMARLLLHRYDQARMAAGTAPDGEGGRRHLASA